MNYAGPIDAVEAMRVANAQASIEFWQSICLVFLAVVAVCAGVYMARKAIHQLRGVLSPSEMAALAFVAGFCTFAAQKRLVSYPRTDPTTAYLIDSGSYVESETDVIHIDFRRLIVPDSAVMFVDRIQRGEDGQAAEGAEWENVFSATFGETPLPLEITHANATNFLWAVYTDWTPGPAVQTNGVWQANWGRDLRRQHIIPLRTAVRLDGETIATPKSKEDSEHEDE